MALQSKKCQGSFLGRVGGGTSKEVFVSIESLLQSSFSGIFNMKHLVTREEKSRNYKIKQMNNNNVPCGDST